jgi:hypothetical protein
MATVSKRYITVLGPVKMEVLNLTAVTDADTVTSRIARPDFGFFVPTTDDNSAAEKVGVAIDGREVTLNNDDLSSDTGVLILFGF